MERAHRVTFHFGADFEVRYVTRLPSRGHLFRRDGTIWLLTALTPDGTGGYEARLASPGEVARRVRLQAAQMRKLSAAQRGRAGRLAEHDAEIQKRLTSVRDRVSG